MRSVAQPRIPTILTILFAFAGVALSVAIGRAIAPGVEATSTSIACSDCIDE